MKRILTINGYLYSQYIIMLENMGKVFRYAKPLHSKCVGGKYYASVEVSIF